MREVIIIGGVRVCVSWGSMYSRYISLGSLRQSSEAYAEYIVESGVAAQLSRVIVGLYEALAAPAPLVGLGLGKRISNTRQIQELLLIRTRMRLQLQRHIDQLTLFSMKWYVIHVF